MSWSLSLSLSVIVLITFSHCKILTLSLLPGLTWLVLRWSLRRLLDPGSSWRREAGYAGWLSEERMEASVEAGVRVAA